MYTMYNHQLKISGSENREKSEKKKKTTISTKKDKVNEFQQEVWERRKKNGG